MSVWSVVPRLSPDPTWGGCFVNIRGSPSVDKEAGERMSLWVRGGVCACAYLDLLVVMVSFVKCARNASQSRFDHPSSLDNTASSRFLGCYGCSSKGFVVNTYCLQIMCRLPNVFVL